MSQGLDLGWGGPWRRDYCRTLSHHTSRGMVKKERKKKTNQLIALARLWWWCVVDGGGGCSGVWLWVWLNVVGLVCDRISLMFVEVGWGSLWWWAVG